MANNYAKSRLVGSVVSMPTFTNPDYSVKLYKHRHHVRWRLKQGYEEGNCGLLIAGGAGETYMLEE